MRPIDRVPSRRTHSSASRTSSPLRSTSTALSSGAEHDRPRPVEHGRAVARRVDDRRLRPRHRRGERQRRRCGRRVRRDDRRAGRSGAFGGCRVAGHGSIVLPRRGTGDRTRGRTRGGGGVKRTRLSDHPDWWRVRDVMTTHVTSVDPSTTYDEMVDLVLTHQVSGLPVTDDAGRLLGTVFEADLMRRELCRSIGSRRRPRRRRRGRPPTGGPRRHDGRRPDELHRADRVARRRPPPDRPGSCSGPATGASRSSPSTACSSAWCPAGTCWPRPGTTRTTLAEATHGSGTRPRRA